VTGGRSEPIAVWDFLEGKSVFSKKLRESNGRTEGPLCVAFAPDGKSVAAGFYFGNIMIWDARTGEELMTLVGHTNEVNAILYTPDSRRIVSASDDATVKLWDTASGMEVITLRGHARRVSSAAMTADGRWLLTSGGGGIHVRDIGAPLPH